MLKNSHCNDMSLNPSNPVSQPMNGKTSTPQNNLASETTGFESLELRETSYLQNVKSTKNIELLEAPSSPPISEAPSDLKLSSLHSHLTVSKPPKKRYIQNGTFKPTQLPVDLQTTSPCSALQELAGGCLSVNRGDSYYSSSSIARFENEQESQIRISVPVMETDIDKDLSQMSFSTSVNTLSQSRKHNLSSFSQSTPLPTDSSSFEVRSDEPINLCKKQAKTFQTSQQKIINHVVDKVLCRPFGNAVSDCFPDTTVGKWQNHSEHFLTGEDTSQKMKIRRTQGVIKGSSDIQDGTKSLSFPSLFSTGESDKRKTLCSRICEVNKYCVDEPFNRGTDVVCNEVKHEDNSVVNSSITESKCPEDSSKTFSISLQTCNNKSLSTECQKSIIFNKQKVLVDKHCDTTGAKSSCPIGSKTIVHVKYNGIVHQDRSSQAENETLLSKDMENNLDEMDRAQCGIKKRKCNKAKEENVDKTFPDGH
ncbi:uncharacterized protein LOC143237684 isoform X2 [Tachypleus tridentatus]|uniref:uncharacterized protein LOC143237684 isoform X2 n=1 Tax=Tachypleus tridentatus TaxID=6853 RepID=UPI003FD0E3AE